MSSNAITEHPDDGRWKQAVEIAPSVMQADVPTVARMFGVVGMIVFALGVVPIVLDKSGTAARIPAGLGLLIALIGMAGLLYHAIWEKELELRRAYGVFAAVWLAIAAAHYVVPVDGAVGSAFLPWGFVSLIPALLFGLAFIHNEDNPVWRQRAIWTIGGAGAVLAVLGLGGGLIWASFLLPKGLLLGLAGLAYLWAYIDLEGPDTDRGYRLGTIVAIGGALAAVSALGWSITLKNGWFGVARDQGYLTSAGILLMGLGVIYSCVAMGLCSDRQFVVLTRRELARFFHSPMVYFILVGFAVIAWLPYMLFVDRALPNPRRMPLLEPIIMWYIFGIVPVFFYVVSVPFLTMHLFSEERRTQTLEVLLTAPVDDLSVVLSKFLAVLTIFMMTWIPYGLYLLALRLEGGQPFDYRPLISFGIAMLCSGAGVVSMGLFFSSLTQNQLVAFVLTLMGMIVLLITYWLSTWTQGTAWESIRAYFSFIDLWDSTLRGKLALTDVIFNLSAAVFWLFLTVKVLESRRWR